VSPDGSQPRAPAAPGSGVGRSARSPGVDREAILIAADDCLAAHGYDALTIRRLAGRLGCAVGTIYRYVADKRELLEALGERRFGPVADAALGGEPLHDTVTRYVHAAQARPGLYRLLFWLAATHPHTPPGLPPAIERVVAAWARRLGHRAAAESLWMRLHGSVLLGHEPRTTLARLDYATDLHGLIPAPAAAARPDAGGPPA